MRNFIRNVIRAFTGCCSTIPYVTGCENCAQFRSVVKGRKLRKMHQAYNIKLLVILVSDEPWEHKKELLLRSSHYLKYREVFLKVPRTNIAVMGDAFEQIACALYVKDMLNMRLEDVLPLLNDRMAEYPRYWKTTANNLIKDHTYYKQYIDHVLV